MVDAKLIRIGSRGSNLALLQTREVLAKLRHLSKDTDFEIRIIKTTGDTAQNSPLAGMGRGIFVKELEHALLDNAIDIAVHSLKDLPTQITPGLAIRVIGPRENPQEALVNRWGLKLMDLPKGSHIGTSSPRRESQLRNLRPDLKVTAIRGNVETRIKKVLDSNYDGTILARAGIVRLGLQAHVSEFLSPDFFVPAPGQGALAMQIRSDDIHLLNMGNKISHLETNRTTTAERTFLEKVGSGCQIPAAAYARVKDDLIVLTVLMATTNGSKLLRAKTLSQVNKPQEAAINAYQQLVKMGVQNIDR